MVFRYPFMSGINRLNAEINRPMEERKDGRTDRWRKGRMDRRTDVGKEGWTDRPMEEGWTDGRTKGRTGEQTDRDVNTVIDKA